MAIPPIGAGSAVCGGGLCGADIPGLSAAIAPMQSAALYDGAARVIPLNADGTVQEIHPVDQEVIFDLTNALGSVPGDPLRGLDIDAIKRATPDRRLQTARDRVKLALAAPLAAGDVEILDVSVAENPLPGWLGLSITYRNLRLPPSSPQSQQPPTLRL